MRSVATTASYRVSSRPQILDPINIARLRIPYETPRFLNSWALGKLTERLASSALPSGPVGGANNANAGIGVPASSSSSSLKSLSPPPPSSVPRHHTSALGLNLDSAGNVSASIPGSVAAAVAAGLPIGGGGGDADRFTYAGAGAGGAEAWNGYDVGGGGGTPGTAGTGDDDWQVRS